MVFGVIRLFRRKENNMKIGLSGNLNEREINMYKGANPLASSYTNSEKPFTNINYGINAYKKENQNPYENQPMQFHNPRLQQYVSPLAKAQAVHNMQTMSQPKYQSVVTSTAPIKQNTTPVNTAPVNQNNPNIDNLKFLESMTAIYEKSGRHDLAQGLKASLSKNNLKA